MAIVLLNEMTFTKDSVTSELISVHCKPIIYFSATTSADSAVVTLTIGSNTLELSALLIDIDITTTYWICDINDLLKYFCVNNGITDEFEILAAGIQTSAITGELNINIETFTDVPASIEEEDFTIYPSHLGHDIPQESGFNLWDVLTLKKTYSQKWCNDTYNAIYINNAGFALTLRDATGKDEIVQRSASDPFEMSQYKFTKKIQEVYGLRKQVVVYSEPTDLGNEIITYTGVETTLAAAIMSPIQPGEGLKSVQLIIEGKRIFNSDVVEYAEIKVNYTDASNDSEKGYQFIADALTDYHFCVTLDTAKTLSSVVVTPLGYEAGVPTARSVYSKDIRVLFEYDNNANQILTSGDALLEKGINILNINTALAEASTNFEEALPIEIEFDPADKYIPLVWFHQSMGFVSYAFEGLAIEGVETDKLDDISLYFNTLVDVNGLKNSLGKKAFPKITLSTQADKKYWPLLKDLFVNRKVYLWVGKYGDADDDTKWVKADVDGSYEINNNLSKTSAIFTVEITLPQQLNAMY